MSVTTQGSPLIPEADAGIPSTSTQDLDGALATLRDRAKAWVDVDVAERIALLDECISATLQVADDWAVHAARAKGLHEDSSGFGEDLGNGPVQVVRNLAMLKHTLEQIRDEGAPRPPGMRVRANGQVAVEVLPVSLYDRVLYNGFTAEVWMQAGVGLDDVQREMGRIYRSGRKDEGGVCLVLGAGNVSSIGPMDCLYKLFVHDRVCLLKMNPVNEHTGPYVAEALAPLVRAGALRIVYGGAEVGRYLTDHEAVDEIHITGSDKTHDAIVYGVGEEQARRKATDDRRIDTPMTSELGNVTPVIVVPGPWHDKDLAWHGDNIASMLTNNAGFNCIAARMIVQHRAWNRRRALLDAVRDSLRGAEQRRPYYPGAVDRWERFTEPHDDAECFGRIGDEEVPFTLLPDLDPEAEDEIAFTTEAFAGVMGEVALDAPRSVPDYIDQAVRFCNEKLWGNLAATIIVHPRSMKDPAIAAAVERAIEDLRYGTVVLNHFTGGAGYAVVTTPWGAYPGNQMTDIRSGRGWVHNSFMLADEQIEKSVVRGPFRTPAKPPWFHTHQRLWDFLDAAMRLQAGDLTQVPRLTVASVRG